MKAKTIFLLLIASISTFSHCLFSQDLNSDSIKYPAQFNNMTQPISESIPQMIPKKSITVKGENNLIYSFVAIFQDSLLIEPSPNSEKEIGLLIYEGEIRSMIRKASIISLNSDKDTIWAFDTTFAGRRCYGSIFSGPIITTIIKNNFKGNIINLYSSSDIQITRLLKGLVVFHSEDGGWIFQLKAEDQ